MPESEVLEEVHRLPIHIRLAQAERRDRPRVEPGPWQERVAPAKCPYFDTGRRLCARSAGMEAEGVGNDERIGRGRDQLRLRQPEFAELIARDRPHQLPLRLVRSLARADADPP